MPEGNFRIVSGPYPSGFPAFLYELVYACFDDAGRPCVYQINLGDIYVNAYNMTVIISQRSLARMRK